MLEASLGPPESTSKMAFRSVQPFLYSLRQCPGACPGMSFPPKRHTLSSQNCPFVWGDLDPYPVHGFVGPPESTPQTASRSVQPFLHSSRQSVTTFYNGPFFSFKIAPSCWGSGPPSNTRFLGPSKPITQTASRSVQQFYRAHYCGRQTDHL